MVGAPVNEGQSLGGVERAPDAFRQAGIRKVIQSNGFGFQDHGNIPEYVDDGKGDTALELDKERGLNVHNSRQLGFKLGQVYQKTLSACAAGSFVLTIGGDRSVGSATVAGYAANKPDLAVVMVGAHADCNTPAISPSGNYHGMPLAHALGWFEGKVPGFEWIEEHQAKYGPLKEDRVALIGIRNLDGPERELVKKSQLNVFTMKDIDQHGIGKVMEMAIERIDRNGDRPIHLSFDIGACDPGIAPGTGTTVRGGMSYRESHYICEFLHDTGRLGSMDLVEVNPALDDAQEKKAENTAESTVTVQMGIELLSSAFGKNIL